MSVTDKVVDSSHTIGGGWRPQVHQLASAEANLCLTEAYCNLCNKGGKTQIKAIEYAGKTIENILNYHLNPPSDDVLRQSYNIIRPALVLIFGGLGRYGDKEVLTKYLEKFVANYSGASPQKSLVLQAVDVIKDEYGTCDTEEYRDILLGKLSEEASELIAKIERNDVIDKLREYAKKFETDDVRETKIVQSMEQFTRICSSQLGRMDRVAINTDRCHEPAIEKINFSKEELEKLKEIRSTIHKDLISGMGWIASVAATIVENVDEEEFVLLRALAAEALKQF